MKIEVKQNIDQKQQKKQQIKQEPGPQISEEQIKTFLRQYELKKLGLQQMYKIYSRNAFTPYFQNTLKSAMVLIFLPALTNLYYTFRPNSPLSAIVPIAMPLLCLSQYFYVINKDFEKFCFTNSEDSKELREKFKILYAYSLNDKVIDNIVEDIIVLEGKEKKKEVV